MVVHYPKNRSLFSFYPPHSCPNNTFQHSCTRLGDSGLYIKINGNLIHKETNQTEKPKKTPLNLHPPLCRPQENLPYFSFRLIYRPTPQTHKCFDPEETEDSSSRPAERAGEQQAVHQALHEADTHDTTSRGHTSLLASCPLG